MGFLIKESQTQTRSAESAIIDIIALDSNASLVSVSGETALLQSDIFNAVRIISSDIASADYKVEKNSKLEDVLNKQANSSTTAYNFMFTLIANTLLNGNGFAEIERDENGLVTGLRNVKSNLVTILESDDGTELGYRVIGNNETREINSRDMIHLKAFTVDGKNGISPIYSLKPELAMQKNGTNLLVNSFKRGITTNGILKLSKGRLNNESKKEIRESFEEANSGSQNSGSVMILDEGESFEQLTVDTKVLEMIQNNKYSTQQIAKVFGIPLSKFGQELVNSSDVQANDLYVSSTLNSYVNMIVQELDNKLNTEIKISFATLLGASKEALLLKLIEEKQGEGVLTVNEVRSFYGLSAIKDGDEVFKNSASQTISTLKGGV
ncbi:phage portal protein [Enterococcus casseliflavus]|uniref:phage portal protein n=1 Tax=Enterococcus TaxID=1350 RepID=UPI001CBEA52E|nr:MULTISPECIES: phage portal protein [Enterococcus]MBZ3642435.1 phage portal protein [Enterococcus casseliflavus]MCD5185867.1 phage portal protein [Enterococcus gallinarum]